MEQNRLLPMILAFWLSLTLLTLFFKTHHGMDMAANYVITLGQVLFDAAAAYLFWQLAAKLTNQPKIAATLFFLAMLALLLSDFFYHATVTLGWFQIPVSGDLFFKLPLLFFFLFLLLGHIKICLIYKEHSERNVLLYGLIILSGFIAALLFFFPAQQVLSDQVNALLSLKTILEILSVVFGLAAMARINKVAFNYLAIGGFLIFLADFIMSAHASNLPDTMRGLELLWMLGSILLATGGYLRLNDSTDG